MLNQTVIVGRLVSTPEVRETAEGKSVANITLAVPQSFKNKEGEYDTDFIECTLWAGIADNTAIYCKQGDLLGVKGRLSTSHDEKSNKNVLKVVAEKVTFLSSRNQDSPVEAR